MRNKYISEDEFLRLFESRKITDRIRSDILRRVNVIVNFEADINHLRVERDILKELGSRGNSEDSLRECIKKMKVKIDNRGFYEDSFIIYITDSYSELNYIKKALDNYYDTDIGEKYVLETNTLYTKGKPIVHFCTPAELRRISDEDLRKVSYIRYDTFIKSTSDELRSKCFVGPDFKEFTSKLSCLNPLVEISYCTFCFVNKNFKASRGSVRNPSVDMVNFNSDGGLYYISTKTYNIDL